MEIYAAYSHNHSEACPHCNTPDNPEDVMLTRVSPCCYICETCRLVMLAGYDDTGMSARHVVGHLTQPPVLTPDKPR